MARSPLFELYDPYELLRQQGDAGLLPVEDDELEPFGVMSLGSRKPKLSDLMPEEEQSSMLGKLAEMGTSGLAGLGWILDTPGAMVRGLLSEGPGKAVSALWDTSDERVTGRELLRQYGMAGKEDNWNNFGGGLAAEIFLDPLTYASFGLNQLVGAPAKTFAGHAAQKAGLLNDFDLFARNTMNMGRREAMRKATPKSILDNMAPEAAEAARQRFVQNVGADSAEEMLNAPIARMNRVGVPWGKQGAYDLFGETVGDATAKWADQVGDDLMTNPYTGPALRGINAAVGDADVLGMTDYDRQWEAKELSSLRRARGAADRRTMGELQFNADAALRQTNSSLADPGFSEALRTYLELGPDRVAPEFAPLFNIPEVEELVRYYSGYRDTAPLEAARRGLRLDEANSRAGTGFVPRQQVGFDVPERPEWPEGVVPPERIKQQYSRGNRRVNFSDNYGRSRREYTDVMGGAGTLNKLSLDGEFQAALRKATPEEARTLLQDWAARNVDNTDGDFYGWMDAVKDDGDFIYKAPELPTNHPLRREIDQLAEQARVAEAAGELHRLPALQEQLSNLRQTLPDVQRSEWRNTLLDDLADFTRTMDPQHDRRQIPIFGQNTFNELSRYVSGRGRVETDADFMLNLLKKQADNTSVADVVGGVNYTADEALQRLGLTGETAMDVLEQTIGRPLDQVSFNKKFVDDWSKVIERGQTPPEISALGEKADDFTKSFKTLALAWPSRFSRDLYSGAFAAAMRGSYNPIDRYVGTQLRKGNYDPLVKPMLGGLIPPRLAGLPEYEELLRTDPDAAIKKFLLDAGSQGLGTSTATDEMLEGAANAGMRELFPGAARPEWSEVTRRFYNPDRSWRDAARDYNPFATRGGAGNRNPLLELADRAAETTDAANRFGTYLTQVRKGAAPEEALRIANLSQVNYAPDAFTNFERDWLKRAIPFYSYSRGILPLIGDELVNQPAGLMGQATRAITRASEPSEDNFTPEYLRQSAAIPLPTGGLFGLDEDSNLKRYLTNIDLPFESVINLVTPGVGNTLFEQLSNTAQKTAMNLLGQTNPLIKGPLEAATNRQFFSGRQLSDLYSVLEQSLGTPGRSLEQFVSNIPGGSRALGTYRQLTDDRLDPSEKYSKFLVNALTGLKFQDVDQERTKRLAARDMLNQLLETTPGVRTYENITVPEEALQKMPEEQRKMYLLYKIIQSEASKRSRDKKKADAIMDPLELLGAIR